MLLVNLRKAISVVALTTSLTTLSVACGPQGGASDARSSDRPGTGSPTATRLSPPSAGAPSTTPGESSGVPASPARTIGPGAHGVESRVVYFGTGTRPTPLIHVVLGDERDAARFPGWFAGSDPAAARAIAARTAGTDFSRNVLVGWARSTGCSQATRTVLFVSGSRLLLGVDQPKPTPECLTDFRVVSVFEVPRGRMPRHPVFGEENAGPDAAGPGRTLAFTRLDSTSGQQANDSRGTEVTEAAQLNAFLARLPGASAAAVRKQTAAHPAQLGERSFGYLLTGCSATGAELLISADGGMTAHTTGGENVRCLRAESYAAIIAVPANVVPVRAGTID